MVWVIAPTPKTPPMKRKAKALRGAKLDVAKPRKESEKKKRH